jgi:hypothetical protein
MVHRQWVLSTLNLRSLSTTTVEVITINFLRMDTGLASRLSGKALPPIHPISCVGLKSHQVKSTYETDEILYLPLAL